MLHLIRRSWTEAVSVVDEDGGDDGADVEAARPS